MEDQRTGWLDWFSRRLGLTEIFSLLTSYGFFHAELDHRKEPRAALTEALSRPMPSYAQWPRVLGLLALILVGVLGFTGVLLTLYYTPTPEGAHSSTATILGEVHFGGFVYQVHYWGAQLLIAVLLVRVVRFFLQGVYRAPRELVWVCAALTLLVAFHSELTGRVLPWTGDGYWSGVRALEVVQAIPVYGSMAAFFSGTQGVAISELTLLRFYIFHIAAFPILLLLLIYLHFSSVRRVGLDPSGEKVREQVGLKEHLVNLAIVLTGLVGVLVTLGILAPQFLPAAADPYATLPGVSPPWYLLAPFGLFELTAGWLPRWVAGSILLIATTAFVFAPFLLGRFDGKNSRGLLIGLACLALATWIALTVYGADVS